VNNIWSFLWVLGIGALSLYACCIPLIGYVAQKRLFRPQEPSYTENTDVLKLVMRNGQKISALYLPNPVAHFTILLSHGNMADLGLCLPLAQQMHAQGFALLVYDYPGYGTSDGAPSEQGVYGAIDAAYEFLTVQRQIPPHRIVAYGRSLGGGPTIDLASRVALGGVIIESTFVSVFRIQTNYTLFPFDMFCNLKKVPKIMAPTLIIHGKLDDIVPFWHAETLYAHIKSPKQHLWLEHAGHSDIEEVAHHEFWQTIHRFCETIKKS
jgi:pimeloyl-ACP methyl ester carboxylesterase